MADSDEKPVETHRFQAEVTQVLHLVVNSLYSHKDVFLRELVSNASDALDKLRFKSIQEPQVLGDDATMEIRITPDEAQGTLTLEDTGVGMTHDELVQNLGTIAHSGSKKFLEALKARGDNPDLSLIGQFGVGFYSAWLVADRVEVVSRAAGSGEAWRWASTAEETFTVERADDARPGRGTAVILHLKGDTREFLDGWRLKELVKKYSDFVAHPIVLATTEEDKPKVETVNQASALWQRSRADVTPEQYQSFYKHLTDDWEAPLAWTHFHVEGNQLFAGLLYVPGRPPFELDNPAEPRRGVRLFVKRVFIMDNCEVLLPTWLRFVRGVIDSEDLPLNVSRETLQDSAVVRAIRKQVVKKTLDLLDELARDRQDDYLKTWGLYGRVLKEALHSDWEYRDRVAALLRFSSSQGEGLVSLQGYIDRMKPGQESIYYVLADNARAAAESPHAEALRKREWEVLYLTDLIDQWAIEGLREYKGKKLLSAERADLSAGDETAKKAREEKQGVLKPLLERAQAVLGERVKDVVASDRLTDSPACLVTPEGALNPSLERVLRAHGKDVPVVRRTLEVNPEHPLIQGLLQVASREPDADRVRDWIELLYEQALLVEGTPIEDPHRFARRLTALLQQAVTADNRV
jgi:molecular chaperone HtpG